MKQIIQNLKTGETILEELPAPVVKPGYVLIRTRYSLVSAGTERMLVEFGKAGLVAKARQQPEKVQMVLDKIRTDGLMPTLESVFRRLNQPLPLGYCNVGEVIEVGEGVDHLHPGDRVASNGPHAEFVCVPKNLVVQVPEKVLDEEAAFAVIGAIGLQGIRLAAPTLGETVVVIGLGLIGLLTAQLLRSSGCRVIGLEVDPVKIELALSLGIEVVNSGDIDAPAYVQSVTGNLGADAVLITASSKSHDIIHQAAEMSRKRGRIVLVGVVGLDLKRSDFYEKELTFQVSSSYGPGRYDATYEDRGIDYPAPFVRWTAGRNFRAVLEAIAGGNLDVKPLITRVEDLADFDKVYGQLGESKDIAALLKYPKANILKHRTVLKEEVKFKSNKGILGIIGAGNFTRMTMLPALKPLGADIKMITSGGGLNAKDLASKYHIPVCATDFKEVLKDDEIDTVVITTRHDQHARMTVEACNAGKHVFVEKPLALSEEELSNVIDACGNHNSSLMVGFNRRFAPFSIRAKKLVGDGTVPMNMVFTINAGHIPSNVWVQDMTIGGGRIIGEACHFIDLATYFSGSLVEQVYASAMGTSPEKKADNVILTLKYKNGSQAVINYLSNGHKGHSKERIEIYQQGRILVIDNFRKMKGYGFKGFSSTKSRQDKGHKKQFELYLKFVKEGGEPLIPFREIVNTTRASFAAVESFMSGQPIRLK